MRASPDFKSLSEEEALADLRERIGHYERAYESVTDEEGAYIKLYNLSSKVSANQVFGRMSTRVLPYLAALHIRERPVYLAALLPGESSESFVRAVHGRSPASPKKSGNDWNMAALLGAPLTPPRQRHRQHRWRRRQHRKTAPLGSAVRQRR